MSTRGTNPGETCWREGCERVIIKTPSEPCRCAIAGDGSCLPCQNGFARCPVCDWSEIDDLRDDVMHDDAIHDDYPEQVAARWDSRRVKS